MQCIDAKAKVLPYINKELAIDELGDFLDHISTCKSCHDELETYYIIMRGLDQLDMGLDELDLEGALERDIRRSYGQIDREISSYVFKYAINTLIFISIMGALFLQIRIWVKGF